MYFNHWIEYQIKKSFPHIFIFDVLNAQACINVQNQ